MADALPLRYRRKIIKLGKSSKAIVMPFKFFKLKPDAKEIIVEEYPDRLVIKFETEVEDGAAS